MDNPSKDPFYEKYVELGLVRHGHFRLSGGACSPYYIGKVVQHSILPQLAAALVRTFSESLAASIETVIGVESGGIRVGERVEAELFMAFGKPLAYVTAYKSSVLKGEFEFADDDDLRRVQGRRCLIVEDTTTTGTALRRVATLVTLHGGNPIAGCVLFNRGGVTNDQCAVDTLYSLIDRPLPTYKSKKDCPDCAKGLPHDPKPGVNSHSAL